MDTEQAYNDWTADPTPERLASVVESLDPTITSEIHRFSGPKHLLRGRAKGLAIKAIKTYDPTRGAKLRSWTVTQLQPLSRYTQQLKPVRSSELALRQAAELESRRKEYVVNNDVEPTDDELADTVGISVARVRKLRSSVNAVVPESSMVNQETGETSLPGVIPGSELSFAAEAVYASLSPRERKIFDWKTGSNGATTLENQEIARRLGISPAAVSQLTATIAGRIQKANQHAL